VRSPSSAQALCFSLRSGSRQDRALALDENARVSTVDARAPERAILVAALDEARLGTLLALAEPLASARRVR
jgi:hypothetical protein